VEPDAVSHKAVLQQEAVKGSEIPGAVLPERGDDPHENPWPPPARSRNMSLTARSEGTPGVQDVLPSYYPCRGHPSTPFRPARPPRGRILAALDMRKRETSPRGSCLAATPTFRPAASAAASASASAAAAAASASAAASVAAHLLPLCRRRHRHLPSHRRPPVRRTPTCPP
jgi:hypothetical protein